MILESILALPNVQAVVWAGLPGQESGNGLVDILYGTKSPSGKLPYTIAKEPADYGTAVVAGTDNYQEGLYIDYRHFDKANIAPRYEFGYGLCKSTSTCPIQMPATAEMCSPFPFVVLKSLCRHADLLQAYTTFAYSSFSATYTDKSPVSSTKAPGGASNLFDTVATVTATITNNGTYAGSEVAQLYIGMPSSAPTTAPKQLRGFQKLPLAAGASGKVTFNVRRRDLAYWDVGLQQWVVPSGELFSFEGRCSKERFADTASQARSMSMLERVRGISSGRGRCEVHVSHQRHVLAAYLRT